MLSRAVIASRHLPFIIKFPNNYVSVIRVASTQVAQNQQKSSTIVEGPERDLVNFPRPTRRIYGGPVRFGFIPEEWFEFFYKKTGVTGPYAFGIGLITYLMSKEIVVAEHEFFCGVSLAIIFTTFIKKFGPKIAETLDKHIDNYEAELNNTKNDAIKTYEDAINGEKLEQWRAQGQKYLFDAKRENVHLQLEAEYRKRLMNVYEEIKKRLDYQLDMQNVSRQFEQKHMVNWIVNSVIKSITPEQEKEALQKCLSDIKVLATRAQ
ncbi:ATP synthase subunit b, mitochondrial-like [Centruroides sculpturatus]|uniref:ATP synthase subunit b, mitochondrial-like n=1 Tax=Centruroides sculpturatus TaxID=218467 RepID=UPI000C6E014F|nr:ATP synthase subunit b, mitochondrial-like [Centruroides sculpturatus]